MALQFAPFASDIELPFYTSLASSKIDHDKLDDSARRILGLYEIRPNDAPEASCRMQILGNALTSDEWAIHPSVRPDLTSMLKVAAPRTAYQKATVEQKASSKTSTPSKTIAIPIRTLHSIARAVQ